MIGLIKGVWSLCKIALFVGALIFTANNLETTATFNFWPFTKGEVETVVWLPVLIALGTGWVVAQVGPWFSLRGAHFRQMYLSMNNRALEGKKERLERRLDKANRQTAKEVAKRARAEGKQSEKEAPMRAGADGEQSETE